MDLKSLVPAPAKRWYRKLRPRTPKLVFSDIYSKDKWAGGSGTGSSPENTAEYRALIERFVRDHDITSVVDIGCGDWQFSRLIDWGEIDYLGLDTVPAVVRANRERFGPRFRFELLDVSVDALPLADLAIMKDVLQHWPNDTVRAFLPQLSAYRYVLVTNTVWPSELLNGDAPMGGYRPLDLRRAPFSIDAEAVLEYHTDESPGDTKDKLVLLIANR